jgi:arylsulfatase A-like enzyme
LYGDKIGIDGHIDETEGPAQVNTIAIRTADRRPPNPILLSPMAAILLAISLGLCAGYLDVGIIVLKKLCWNPEGYYRIARDFPWSVPASHAALMAIAGVAVAVVSRLRPGLVSVRAGSWLLATLALWGALLRLPLYGLCSLALAAGIGRLIADAIAARNWRPGRLGFILAALLVVLSALAAGSSGWQVLREYRVVSGLPPAPSTRNVVLIVWDTVRAYNLGFYGYPRATTPNLARWARKGVKYQFALAPAPWTYPSHACFFTGQWPFRTNSQWKHMLDTPDPTLAEYLVSRGYQTAGFVANTNSCTYEGGLARGFAHFEDYTQTLPSLLARTVPGQWMLKTILGLSGDFVDEKWVGLQSRDARRINRAFLDWLDRRRPDRPFFAFLNLFDAHEPYIPPASFAGRFGIRPTTRQDYQLLMDFVGAVKGSLSKRDHLMARDCYDDCIAYLDEQLGRLLDELERRGLLADTDVIITSDHGEAFGDHAIFGHAYSVNFDEVGVPLVILGPDAPAGRTVQSPVSLRDLPATVVDRLGLSEGSPFPGRSLAAYWGLAPGQVPAGATTPAFSEQSNATAFQPRPGPGGGQPGFQMSIVTLGHHYIRDGTGGERLFDLINDPFESVNLLASAGSRPEVDRFRRVLLKVLNDEPGSVEVEQGYLDRFRRALEAAVGEGPGYRVAAEPRGGTDRPVRTPGPAS